MRFDRVVVMRQGRIVEEGPAALLATRGGHFARMRAAARLVDGSSPSPSRPGGATAGGGGC